MFPIAIGKILPIATGNILPLIIIRKEENQLRESIKRTKLRKVDQLSPQIFLESGLVWDLVVVAIRGRNGENNFPIAVDDFIGPINLGSEPES